jgi:hypothetical protein
MTITPASASGAPSMLGMYEVNDVESERIDTTIPHAMRNAP